MTRRKRLIAKKFEVSVERGAGLGAMISDADYEAAGARIDVRVRLHRAALPHGRGGELHQLEVNPALSRRRAEFERAQQEMADSLPTFINEMVEKLRGQRIWLLATWNVLYGIARAGLDAGPVRVHRSTRCKLSRDP